MSPKQAARAVEQIGRIAVANATAVGVRILTPWKSVANAPIHLGTTGVIIGACYVAAKYCYLFQKLSIVNRASYYPHVPEAGAVRSASRWSLLENDM
jgi:hypothetical protein